jgi:tRNA dimethylallyltransferase
VKQQKIKLNTNKVIGIVGPTAVGKTAVAMELTGLMPAEIVSADSMAVYRGMDIGTAKPTPKEREIVKFHLIDIASPLRNFSVGEFQRIAHEVIDSILLRNHFPLVVGGSGLYVKAAIDGLNDELPGDDIEFRESVSALDNQALFLSLKLVDPETAEKIDKNNRKRLIRALEIYHLTGVPASKHYENHQNAGSTRPNSVQFGLFLSKPDLDKKVDQRVDEMIACGLVDEVRQLIDSGVSMDTTAMQALGYKEIVLYLNRCFLLSEAIELIKTRTRQFAKRQMTWFRKDNRIQWIDVAGRTVSSIALEITEILDEQAANELTG